MRNYVLNYDRNYVRNYNRNFMRNYVRIRAKTALQSFRTVSPWTFNYFALPRMLKMAINDNQTFVWVFFLPVLE